MTGDLYRRLEEHEFQEEFRPLLDPSGAYRDYFPSEPEERDELLAAAAEHRVWTLVDVDGFLLLSAGWHLVNRLSHVITERAYNPETQIEVFDSEDWRDWLELDPDSIDAF